MVNNHQLANYPAGLSTADHDYIDAIKNFGIVKIGKINKKFPISANELLEVVRTVAEKITTTVHAFKPCIEKISNKELSLSDAFIIFTQITDSPNKQKNIHWINNASAIEKEIVGRVVRELRKDFQQNSKYTEEEFHTATILFAIQRIKQISKRLLLPNPPSIEIPLDRLQNSLTMVVVRRAKFVDGLLEQYPNEIRNYISFLDAQIEKIRLLIHNKKEQQAAAEKHNPNPVVKIPKKKKIKVLDETKVN